MHIHYKNTSIYYEILFKVMYVKIHIDTIAIFTYTRIKRLAVKQTQAKTNDRHSPEAIMFKFMQTHQFEYVHLLVWKPVYRLRMRP